MRAIIEYLRFLRKNGRPLSEINPGSTEIALTVDDVLQALELLKDSETAIFGGDILSEDKRYGFGYVIHLWGNEYCYLDWYCDQEDNESHLNFALRSYELAKKSIIEANRVAKELKKKCYIVFVI